MRILFFSHYYTPEGNAPATRVSAQSLVECVERLVADPALSARLGENAYRHIALVHNRDSQAKDYLSILENMA